MKSLSAKFLLPFSVLTVLIAALVFYVTYEASYRHAHQLVNKQLALALEFDLAVRTYAAERIRPVMAQWVGKDGFIPETMSTSFISRQIFERARKKFPDLLVRFPSEKPRNPNNQATADELAMIEYFRDHREVESRTEELEFEGRRFLVHFAPRWLKPECMRCHGNPEDAPAELVKRYGATAGFYRTVGEVAGLDMVAVPVNAAHAVLVDEMRSQSVILAAGLVLLFGLIFLVFRFTVTKRLEGMAEHFNEIAAHVESPAMIPVPVTGSDEISVVGMAFNRLIDQLRATQASLELRVNERTDDLRKVNDLLQRELAERMQMEDKLRLSEEKYRSLVETTSDCIWEVDVQGRYTYLSPKFQDHTGYPPEAFLGKSPLDLVPTPEASPDEEQLSAVLAAQQSFTSVETRFLHRDGRMVTVESSGVPLFDLKGEYQGMRGISRDITKRKRAEGERVQLEERLHQAQKAESLGRMAGAIAHHFNNLLAVVIGRLELALGDPQQAPRPLNHLTEALNASQRAVEISRLMLTYLGQTIQKKEPCNIVETVREALLLLRPSLPPRVQVKAELPSEAIMIQGDKGHVEQALTNLILNAGEAVGDGDGRITVAVDVVTAEKLRKCRFFPSDWEPTENRYVSVAISDTGSGFDPAMLERIFDPFFSTKFVGRGLGLAVVLGIVRAHGGALASESRPGQGSVFRVFFPLPAPQILPPGQEPKVDRDLHAVF